MDRDLNAYRCAEPHGGCCQTSKIRPDNYFFAGAFFGEPILRRSCGSIGARIAVGMGDQENDVDGYVGQDRTGEAADFRAAHAGRTEAVAIGFRCDQTSTDRSSGPTGPKSEKCRLYWGRRYEKYPSNTDLSQHALCCRVSWSSFFRVSLSTSSGSKHTDQRNGHQRLKRVRIRESDSGTAPHSTSSQLYQPWSADPVHRRS